MTAQDQTQIAKTYRVTIWKQHVRHVEKTANLQNSKMLQQFLTLTQNTEVKKLFQYIFAFYLS